MTMSTNKFKLMLLIAILVIVAGGGFAAYKTLSGNKDVFALKYNFDQAIVKLPNGETIKGDVKVWTQSREGNYIRVTFKDGSSYLTGTENVALIDK